jgi:hypothetical protein
VATIPRHFLAAAHRLELTHARQKLHPVFQQSLKDSTYPTTDAQKAPQSGTPTRNLKTGGTGPATDKQKAYLSQLGVRFDTSTMTKSEASLLISQEERRLAQAIPATEKQKAFLADLGVEADTSSLCLDDASRLIEQAMPLKPATVTQIQKLRRLGYKDSVSGMTAENAGELIGRLECGRPTDEQFALAEKLGLRFLKTRNFKAGDLDDILKCADRPPSAELLRCVTSYGVHITPKTELEARFLYELARTHIAYMPDQVQNVCLAAMEDPDFYRPIIGSYCQIKWPKEKLRQWAAAGKCEDVDESQESNEKPQHWAVAGDRPTQANEMPTVLPIIPASSFSDTVSESDSDAEIVRKIRQGVLRQLNFPGASELMVRVFRGADGKFELSVKGPDDLVDIAQRILGL